MCDAWKESKMNIKVKDEQFVNNPHSLFELKEERMRWILFLWPQLLSLFKIDVRSCFFRELDNNRIRMLDGHAFKRVSKLYGL
jgi:hypothetical protein